MTCNYCKNKIPCDSEFCPFCGNQTNNKAESESKSSYILEIEKGYTYLELKEWEKATAVFDSVIINSDEKSKAYIGRLLAQLKFNSVESLYKFTKNLSDYCDFNMAIKYADKDYLEKLESIKALNLSNVDKQKRKSKRCMLASILVTCALLIVAVIAYFVFIPLGRYHIYESLIKDERIDEAIEMYLDSRWHEDGNYVKSIFYDHGIELYNKKEYNSAKKLLKVTNGYNDSEEKIIEIDNVLRISKIKNTKIGDTVTFGVYEQDGILENGSEKIEWIVLKKDNKKALIISKYCLDCIPYTLDAVDEAMWETSYLRTWLNNNFYNKSFDDFEKEHIINSTINNYDYVHVSTGKKLQFMDGTEGSYILVPSKVEREATRDYLFVLSIDEAEDFFDTSKKRKAKPTLYAKNNGADTSYGDGSHAFWWLRNDPDMNYNHSLVSGKGGISTNSISVDNLWATVRPAMWINIEE